MMRSWVLVFLLLVGAQLSAMPADIFFKPPGIEQISISPDGQLVAMIARPGDQRVLEIATPLTGQSQALKSVGWAPISSFRWLGPRTLSFKVYVEEVQHSSAHQRIDCQNHSCRFVFLPSCWQCRFVVALWKTHLQHLTCW